jgi:hypothetical protein
LVKIFTWDFEGKKNPQAVTSFKFCCFWSRNTTFCLLGRYKKVVFLAVTGVPPSGDGLFFDKPGVSGALNANNGGNLGHGLFKVIFNAHFERHLGHGASAAGAGEFNRNRPIFGKGHKFHIPAIRLEGGAYCIQSGFNLFFKHGKSPVEYIVLKNYK